MCHAYFLMMNIIWSIQLWYFFNIVIVHFLVFAPLVFHHHCWWWLAIIGLIHAIGIFTTRCYVPIYLFSMGTILTTNNISAMSSKYMDYLWGAIILKFNNALFLLFVVCPEREECENITTSFLFNVHHCTHYIIQIVHSQLNLPKNNAV